MVQNSEFDGNMATSSTFDARTALLDLFTEIERPFRVGSGSVENSRDIIFQYDRGEETNIDVPRNLKDVLVLPDFELDCTALKGIVVNLPFLFLLIKRIPGLVLAILVH